MNFISYFSLLNDISDKLEIIKEKQELPEHPHSDQDQSNSCKGNHGLTILQLNLCCYLKIIHEYHDGKLHSDIAQLNENVYPVGKFGLRWLINEVEG